MRVALEKAALDWPAAVAIIRRNIGTMRRAESCSERYLARWEELVEQGRDIVVAVILADTNEGQVLRSIFPMGGILTEFERLTFLARFKTTN
jgi:hypothetical protein